MKFASESILHQKFLENMLDAVLILDEKFNILDCNHVATVWYGYSPSEIRKLNLSDLRAPEEREKINIQMHGVTQKQGDIWETVHLRKDGSKFNVEVSSTPIEVDGQRRFYHVVRDITERKRIEQALRASEERYRNIVEFNPDAVFIHRDDKVIFMNPAGLKLFGANDLQEVIGRSLWDFYPPERHGVVRSRNQMLKNTKQVVPTVEHTVLRLDGGRINVEATACMIDYDGEQAIFVTMRDITERKKNRTLLDLQHAVSKCLIESANLIDASKCVLEIICNNLKLDLGSIWAYDKKHDGLHLITSWNSEQDIEGITTKLPEESILKNNEKIAGMVLATGEAYWVENANDEYNLNIAVPITNENELLGVIECMSRKTQHRDDVILQSLISLGDQVGLFLKRKKYEKDLAYLAKHDTVTGLPNRSSFEDMLNHELNFAKSRDQMLAVIFVDIDAFNIFNESMGHNAGDELIKTIASRMVTLGLANEHLGRFGPQFAIILNMINSVEDITKFIKDINRVLGNEFIVQDQKINVSFNYGIAIFPENGEDTTTLLRSAGIALTSAKEVGGGSIQFGSRELNLRAQKRAKLENDLRVALTNNEFKLQYQPIIDVNTLTVSGFESLLRWQKDGEFINPADFIPLVERNHLIVPIGEWIMQHACQQYKKWQNLMQHKIFISVNISPIQFKHGLVLGMIEDVLQETKMEPQCLKIEVTESALMDNAHKSINTLRAIKDIGVKISIDDFGTGYSSLNYLRHLPIDYLKIDQSFIHNMTTDANDAAIVKTIIDLAHNLNYQVIAEGVETQEQLNFLTTLGCYNIQGYYFSPPLEADDATAFLQQGKLLR